MCLRALVLAPVFLTLTLAGAEAHSYSTGKAPYSAFLEGSETFLTDPTLLLPVIALGIGLILWMTSGLLHTWHFFVYGMLAGVAAAPFAESWAEVLPMSLGTVIAAHAALVAFERNNPVLPWFAAITGFSIVLSGFYGHSFTDVPVATRFGFTVTALIILSMVVALVKVSLTYFPQPVTTILWRIGASWIAAILVLYLAFTLRG